MEPSVPAPLGPYDYYELIKLVERLDGKIDLLFQYLQDTLTPILWCVVFYIIFKIAFSCVRGYKS